MCFGHPTGLCAVRIHLFRLIKKQPLRAPPPTHRSFAVSPGEKNDLLYGENPAKNPFFENAPSLIVQNNNATAGDTVNLNGS